MIHVKPTTIQKHKWLDGMHLGSEIPHYYTRYMATLKGNIAMVVTFSAHKLFYTKYSSEFFRAIKSLRVIATRSQKVTKRELHSGKGMLGDNIGSHLNDVLGDMDELMEDETASGGGLSTDMFFMIGAGILLLIGLIVMMRSRG